MAAKSWDRENCKATAQCTARALVVVVTRNDDSFREICGDSIRLLQLEIGRFVECKALRTR